MMIKSEGWRKQSSALKNCVAVSKEKGFRKNTKKTNGKNAQNRCLVPKQSALAKNCGLLTGERVEDNKKSVPILRKGLIFWCIKHKFWSE